MKKVLLLAAAAVLFAGSAKASTVDVDLGNTAGTFSYSTGAGSLSPNINLGSYAGLALNNASVEAAGSSSTGNYASPSGSLYGNNYLSVFGVPTTGSATFALATGENTFSFTWGTLDAYNTLTLTDSRGSVYTLSGADILSQIFGATAGTSQADVVFSDKYGTIVSAQLASTQNSFEAANFGQGVSSVPLPASFPLFALAMVGMFVVAQRKANKA